MPILLETIDAIARRQQRDVIFLDIRNGQDRSVRDRPEIAEATASLDAEGIAWTACLGFAPGMLLIGGGPRAIHIDVAFDPSSAVLAKLETRFETPDGQPRHSDLVLTLLTLEDAQINAEQDSLGFWDNI